MTTTSSAATRHDTTSLRTLTVTTPSGVLTPLGAMSPHPVLPPPVSPMVTEARKNSTARAHFPPSDVDYQVKAEVAVS